LPASAGKVIDTQKPQQSRSSPPANEAAQAAQSLQAEPQKKLQPPLQPQGDKYKQQSAHSEPAKAAAIVLESKLRAQELLQSTTQIKSPAPTKDLEQQLQPNTPAIE